MVRRVDPHDENHGMVQRVFGLCAVANATEVDEPLQARKQRHEIVPKMLNIIINIEKEGCQTEARKMDGGRGKKSREGSARDWRRNLKLEASWRKKKVCGTLPERECWKTA